MKILCSIHLYPPTHLCGAEMFLHRVNKYLMSKGHEVRVLLHQANHYKIKQVYCYEGIDVFPPDQMYMETLFLWADVVFTHLDYTNWTIQMGKIFKRKIVHFVHNTHPYKEIVHAAKPQWIVYNAHHAEKTLNYPHEGIVIHPPTSWKDYDINRETSNNKFITLINANRNKGAHILYKIAAKMPDREFLVVMGSYDQQLTGDIVEEKELSVKGLVRFFEVTKMKPTPINVTLVNKTLNIREVYEQTRVLLMPSEYESWGLTMTEAMSSGIPVISTKTDGLLENGGDAGIYIKDRDDIDSWIKAIKKLDNIEEYKKASKKCKKRSRELDPINELNKFESWLEEIKERPY